MANTYYLTETYYCKACDSPVYFGHKCFVCPECGGQIEQIRNPNYVPKRKHPKKITEDFVYPECGQCVDFPCYREGTWQFNNVCMDLNLKGGK